MESVYILLTPLMRKKNNRNSKVSTNIDIKAIKDHPLPKTYAALQAVGFLSFTKALKTSALASLMSGL